MRHNAALLVRVQAQPGKQDKAGTFLYDGLAIMNDEPGTASIAGVDELFARPPAVAPVDVIARKLSREGGPLSAQAIGDRKK